MSQQDATPPAGDELVKAGAIPSPAFAEEVRTRLDEVGITATLQGDPSISQESGLGLMSPIDIMAPPGDVARARAVIADVAREHNVQASD